MKPGSALVHGGVGAVGTGTRHTCTVLEDTCTYSSTCTCTGIDAGIGVTAKGYRSFSTSGGIAIHVHPERRYTISMMLSAITNF